jgi:hypothetical protein
MAFSAQRGNVCVIHSHFAEKLGLLSMKQLHTFPSRFSIAIITLFKEASECRAVFSQPESNTDL